MYHKSKNVYLNIKNIFYNKDSDYLLEKFSNIFDNKFLNFFFENKNIIWDNKEKDKKIKIPDVFSLTKNFDKTMKTMEEIATVYFSLRNINLDFSECKVFDISASALLIVILLNLENHRYKKVGYFKIKLLGNNSIVNELFINGIGEYLDISKPINSKQRDFYGEAQQLKDLKFKNLKLLGGGETNIEFQNNLINRNLFIPAYMGETIEEPVNFINESLGTKNIELTAKGRKKFKEIIGEIVNNSRIHLGNGFNQYFLIGNYYNSDIGRGSLLFFNFGDTISQTFIKTESQKIKNLINDLFKHYEKEKYFDKTFSKESLLTLMSIQDKISSVYEENESRGTGMTKMIRNFLELSNFNENPPKSFIISGHVKISLDNELKKEDKNITFNKEKSLKYKPDIEKVKLNKRNYPGTMILIEFNIDSEWLKGEKNE